MSQVRHLNIHAHLCFIALIQDIKHLFRVVSNFDGIKVDFFLSKLLYLLLYNSALGVTLRIIVTASVVVLCSVARSVGNKNSILALRLPVLLERILKTSRHIFWQVSTTRGSQLFQEILTSGNVITKAKDF
jgi:hypothetical protein